LALSLGLAYWLVKIDNMRPDAQWQWSWRRIRLGHRTARWAARQAGLLPGNLLRFLAHADGHMLLRRTGGGYQFLHHTLQEHIAMQDPGHPPNGPARSLLTAARSTRELPSMSGGRRP